MRNCKCSRMIHLDYNCNRFELPVQVDQRAVLTSTVYIEGNIIFVRYLHISQFCGQIFLLELWIESW